MNKGNLSILMLVLLVLSYFIYENFGPASKEKKEVTTVITITGLVTDRETGKAIVKAVVRLGGTPTSVFTNGNGEYSIPGNKGDQLQFSHPNYRRMAIEVTDEVQDVQLIPKESRVKEKLKEDFPDMQIIE